MSIHRDLSKAVVSRRRCHTACQPCRAARVRCNGENPCLTCLQNQRDCRYSTAHNYRVSRVTEHRHDTTTTNHNPNKPSDPPSPTDDAWALLPASDDGHTSIPLSERGALDSIGLTWPADGVSWPWLHESLYLQGSPLDLIDSSRPKIESSMAVAAAAAAAPGQREIATTPVPLHDRSVAQARVVEELTIYATSPDVESPTSRDCYWQSMSLRVAEAFGFGDWRRAAAETEPALLHLVSLYQQHFSPLWPLLSGIGFDPPTLHPVLFLTLASIGAMYGTPQECSFGTAMHEKIRKALATPLFGMEETDEKLMPLGQARLLTQVAALYFGQRRAFSYAQHLGAIIIAQARRMDLFSSQRSFHDTDISSPADRYTAWLASEARKRLAFGILRADIFSSVLLNSRPMLSPEEVNLDMPAPDLIWMGTDEAQVHRYIAMAPRGLPFCDLVRIAFDRSEALLGMEPAHYEMLLFGLQEPVWRFSHDPRLIARLTGQAQPSHGALDDPLGIVHRRMQDLQDDRCRLTDALQKWESSFTAVRTTNEFQSERSSILSSLLLLQLSHLRLLAPLADLHGVAYALSHKQPVDPAKLQMLTAWARSPEAYRAADYGCQIWGLLDCETTRPAFNRARHNLLAFSGLHHAAVVLWVVSGSHGQEMPGLPGLPGRSTMDRIVLCRRQSGAAMNAVVHLYRRLTLAGWCSFAAAAECLSLHAFPANPTQGASSEVTT